MQVTTTTVLVSPLIPLGSADPVETINFTVRNSSDVAYVGAIEIGGAVLVDAGSIGSNGFFLPFDSEAEGGGKNIQILYLVLSHSQKKNYSTERHKECDFNGGQASPYADYTFNPGISFTKLEIKASNNTQNLKINKVYSSEFGNDLSNPVKLDVTADVPSPLTSFSLGNTGGSTAKSAVIYGIYVDGVLLQDNVYSPIGADASGQGNNFVDKNFNLGVDNSQDWSAGA